MVKLFGTLRYMQSLVIAASGYKTPAIHTTGEDEGVYLKEGKRE